MLTPYDNLKKCFEAAAQAEIGRFTGHSDAPVLLENFDGIQAHSWQCKKDGIRHRALKTLSLRDLFLNYEQIICPDCNWDAVARISLERNTVGNGYVDLTKVLKEIQVMINYPNFKRRPSNLTFKENLELLRASDGVISYLNPKEYKHQGFIQPSLKEARALIVKHLVTKKNREKTLKHYFPQASDESLSGFAVMVSQSCLRRDYLRTHRVSHNAEPIAPAVSNHMLLLVEALWGNAAHPLVLEVPAYAQRAIALNSYVENPPAVFTDKEFNTEELMTFNLLLEDKLKDDSPLGGLLLNMSHSPKLVDVFKTVEALN